MSRASVSQLLWWLVTWNLGSLLEYMLGGPWTLIGIASGTLVVLAMRMRALSFRPISPGDREGSPDPA